METELLFEHELIPRCVVRSERKYMVVEMAGSVL